MTPDSSYCRYGKSMGDFYSSNTTIIFLSIHKPLSITCYLTSRSKSKNCIRIIGLFFFQKVVRFPWIDPILLSKIPGELIGEIKVYILISRNKKIQCGVATSFQINFVNDV
jgi:hypothetical protein